MVLWFLLKHTICNAGIVAKAVAGIAHTGLKRVEMFKFSNYSLEIISSLSGFTELGK